MVLPESSPVVSRIERIPRRGEYLVTFSDGTDLRILKDQLAGSGIEEGTGVSRRRIAELDTVYKYTRARQAAVRLLKVRPRTELEIRKRLGALGTGPATARRVISDLKAEGRVDDRIFARLWIEEKSHRGDSGRLRIRSDLEAKGIPRDVVADELERTFNEKDEALMAGSLALKKVGRLGGVPAREAMRKTYTYLLRRGFPSEAAAEAARQAVETAGRVDEDEV